MMPLRIGGPQVLFEFDNRNVGSAGNLVRVCDVAADVRWSYADEIQTPPPPPVVTHINLVQNWFKELKAMVPASGAK
jgi:hypothetical protein